MAWNEPGNQKGRDPWNDKGNGNDQHIDEDEDDRPF